MYKYIVTVTFNIVFVWQLWQCCDPQRRSWPEATEAAQEKSSAESQEPHQIFWDQYRQHTVGDQHYTWQGTDWVFFEECTDWGWFFLFFVFFKKGVQFQLIGQTVSVLYVFTMTAASSISPSTQVVFHAVWRHSASHLHLAIQAQ